MAVLMPADGLKPLYPPQFEWKKVMVIDPRDTNRVMPIALVVRNILVPDPTSKPTFFEPQALIMFSEVVTPITLVNAITDASTIIEFEVLDFRYASKKVEVVVLKAFRDSFYLARKARGVVGRYKCYIPRCLVVKKRQHELGDHFKEDHLGVLFDVRKVMYYIVNGRHDPHVIHQPHQDAPFVYVSDNSSPISSTPIKTPRSKGLIQPPNFGSASIPDTTTTGRPYTSHTGQLGHDVISLAPFTTIARIPRLPAHAPPFGSVQRFTPYPGLTSTPRSHIPVQTFRNDVKSASIARGPVRRIATRAPRLRAQAQIPIDDPALMTVSPSHRQAPAQLVTQARSSFEPDTGALVPSPATRQTSTQVPKGPANTGQLPKLGYFRSPSSRQQITSALTKTQSTGKVPQQLLIRTSSTPNSFTPAPKQTAETQQLCRQIPTQDTGFGPTASASGQSLRPSNLPPFGGDGSHDSPGKRRRPPKTATPKKPTRPAKSPKIRQPDTSDPDPRNWVFNDERDDIIARYNARFVPVPNLVADDVERFCICMQPDDEDREWIECSNKKKCLMEWFHPECLGISEDKIPALHADWFCPRCTAEMKKSLHTSKPNSAPEVIDLTSDSARPETQASPKHLPRQRSQNKSRTRTKRVLEILTDPKPGLTMSKPSPIDMKPWSADMEKSFVNDPETAKIFGFNTLEEAKSALRARRHRDADSDGDYEMTTMRTPKTPSKQTPKSSWSKEEEDALVEVVTGLVESGLSGEPLWAAAYPMMIKKGINRAVGGMKMRWCRGLRLRTKVDERRRKDESNLLTALQVKGKQGEKGKGRGKSTQYGKAARARAEAEANARLSRSARKTHNEDVDMRDLNSDSGADDDYFDEEEDGSSSTDIEIEETRTPIRRKTKTSTMAAGAQRNLVREETDVQDAILLSLATEAPKPARIRRAVSAELGCVKGLRYP